MKASFLVCMLLVLAESSLIYEHPGDIRLGILAHVHNSGERGQKCGDQIVHPRRMQYVEVVVYTINQINKNPDLLPNVTLGFVFLDDCDRPSTSLARSLQFIPKEDQPECYLVTNSCSRSIAFDVVGVIGPYSSSSAMLVSPLLGYYDIPQISAMATDEDLSDKDKYEYFLRVVPPDQYQAHAMVALIQYFNWTYVSVLYRDSTYGLNGIKNIRRLARDRNICIAYAREVPPYAKDSFYDGIIESLLKKDTVKVVLLFLYPVQGHDLMAAAIRWDVYNRFVWVGSEGFDSSAYTGVEAAALGGFHLSVISSVSHPFKQYFESLTPENNPDNPWYNELWEDTFGCKWQNRTCREVYHNITQANRYFVADWNYLIMDAVLTYAHALHNLLHDACPNITRRAARACVKGRNFLEHLHNVSFQGVTGPIRFDGNGDIMNQYTIKQLVKTETGYETVISGTWSRETNAISIHPNKIKFYIKPDEGTVPASVCSPPCGVGQYYVKGDIPCCWSCHPCRDNEVISSNKTYCESCPTLSWPDNATRTACLPIEPSYLSQADVAGAIIILLASVSIILSAITMAIFIRHQNRKVIKSSSLHIMYLLLISIAINSLMSTASVLPVNRIVCYLRIAGFHLACTMLYGPLCVKTIRIYRFFAAASKCKTRLKCVSPVDTLFLSAVPICFQISQLVVLMAVHPPGAIQHQPVEVEKYVELRCVTPAVSFLAPLTLNLLLLVVCATFGFLTRKLPDCFNESLCIFFSVVTTLVVWAAFLPTYYLMFYAYYQDLLLALALLLNCFVFLFGLFGPKIYAVYFLEETKIKTSNYDAEVSKITMASTRVRGSSHDLTHALTDYAINPLTL